MSTSPAADPLARIKQGAKWLWSQGDYTRLATLLEAPAQALAAGCVTSGMTVLDVAAGNGNLAHAAARLGARVTASTSAAHGRTAARHRAEGIDITWVEADAESLAVVSNGFDLAAFVFGAMFAPRPELVAAEMFRAVRPGGVVAMANYSSAGYLGRLSDIIGGFSSTPPSSLPSPFLWGDADEVRRRFHGLASEIEIVPRTLTFRFASLAAWRDEFADVNPPLMALKQILPPAAYDGLIAQAVALVEELNRAGDGSVVLESGYLAVIARK